MQALDKKGIDRASLGLFAAFGGMVLCCIFAAILSEFYFLAGLPLAALVAFQAVNGFKKLYFLLLFCIPISMEYFFGSFGTDLPMEPLLIGLMLIYLVWLCRHWKSVRKDFLLNPITVLLFVHWSWILVSAINSNLFVISMKFFLAKSWYIIVFYFLTAFFIRTKKDVQHFFWALFIPILLAVSFVMVKHAMVGFSFYEVHSAMRPLFRNHVNYAALLALFFPFLILARSWYPEGPRRWLINFALLFFMAAIQFSYTRAAYLGLIIAAGAYFVIQWRLVKYALGTATIVMLLGITYVVQNNKYLDYAPDYYKTITHDDFDDLISATYKLEDISTMERVYRWVAAMRMCTEEPLTGFGPGNFYNFYRGYTVTRFETYVSDNPEKSGVHSYFLMILIDQGIPGLILFVIFVFYILIRGEQAYHGTVSADNKAIIMTLLLSMIVIYSFLLINDMVETAKVGSFFFMNIAILVNLDLQRHKVVSSDEESKIITA